MANSAGVIFAPDGKTKLSGSGRSINENDLKNLKNISKKYPAKANITEALIPDFKYLKMGFATASAEQRLLLVISRPENKANAVQRVLAPVVWDSSIQGKFHVDLESDIGKYRNILDNLRVNRNGSILVIEPDKYGIEGKVLKQLPLNQNPQTLVRDIVSLYDNYMRTKKAKKYSQHVREGKKDGIYLDLPIQLGEDRDGDGKVDENNIKRFGAAEEKAKKSGKVIRVDN